VDCFKPKGALYLFPQLDPNIYPIKDDVQLVLDFLQQEKVLLVHGTGFNWPTPDHLRIVFLPHVEEITLAMERFADFLERIRN